MKKCPYCAEEIQDEAVFCRWCRRDLLNSNDRIITTRVYKILFALIVLTGFVVIAFGFFKSNNRASEFNIHDLSTGTAEIGLLTNTPNQEFFLPTVEIVANFPTPSPATGELVLPTSSGWVKYNFASYEISLPERWEVLNIEKEGIEAIYENPESRYSEFLSNSSPEEMSKKLKLAAIDTNISGSSVATVFVSQDSLSSHADIYDLCYVLPNSFSESGVETLDARCDMEINGLKTARFLFRDTKGRVVQNVYIYIILKGFKIWTIVMRSSETEFEMYRPVFWIIADSFKVNW